MADQRLSALATQATAHDHGAAVKGILPVSR